MTLKVSKSGVFKLCGPLHVAKSGVWKDIARIRIWKTYGNPPLQGWRDLYVVGSPPATPPPSPPPPPPPPPVGLTVTPNPTTVSGLKTGKGTVYTNTTTITASGGTGPYSYVFSLVAHSGTIIPAILQQAAPNANKAQFSRNMQGTVPEYQTARFKCAVADSLGNIGSCFIDAEFYTDVRESNWTNQAQGGGSIP